MPIYKLMMIAFILATLSVLSGCGSDSSNTETSPQVPTTTNTVTLGVQAVDASTGEPIPNASLTITNGASNFTQSSATADADTGSAIFTTNEGVSPSATNPISISVSASAAGFTTSGQTTTIESEGAADLSIPLASITGATPTGVEVAQVNATSTNGNPSAPITATVESDASNGTTNQEASSITIGTQVQMTDSAGSPVSGDVSVTVGYYDANSEDALEAFPGGFSVAVENASAAQANADTSVTGEVGSDNELTFVSAGFTSVEITNENGDKVKNFSEPVPVTMTISADTQNPDTGGTVAIGDELPIWSYDADTGKWTYEAEGIVTDNDDGDGNTSVDSDGLLQVVHQTRHLSYFNLDWYRSGTRRCTGRINVLDSTGNAVTKRLRVRISNTSGNSRTITYTGDGFIQLIRLLRGIETVATFRDTSTGEIVGIIGGDLPDLCGTNDINLNIVPPSTTTLTVKTVTYCSNNAAEPDVAVSSSYIYLFQDQPRWSYIGSGRTDSAGEYVFTNLVVPSSGAATPTYRLYVYDRINRRWDIARNQVFSEGTATYTARFPQTCDLPPTTGAG